jgi:hypothetical protein
MRVQAYQSELLTCEELAMSERAMFANLVRLMTLLLGVCVLLVVSSAFAQTQKPSFSTSVTGALVEVSFELNEAENAQLFEFGLPDIRQDNRSQPNRYDRLARMEMEDTYTITVRVRDASKRFSVCIFIDGVHVIGKKPINGAIEQIATCRKAAPEDYIISVDSDTIEGWRASPTSQKVTKFVVKAAAQSVAALQERPSAKIGVIAIAVFSEVPKVPGKASAKIGTRGFGPIGTGEGMVVDSKTESVGFKARGDVADEVYFFRYATGDTLRALGVLPRGNHGASISK